MTGSGLFCGADPLRAVAVRAGVITAVGLDALEWQGRVPTVDTGRGFLLPAFRDGHVHPLWAGRAMLGAPIAGAPSVPELLARVAAYARAHPRLDWISGSGYDPTLLPGGHGRAEVLDAVLPDRPVLLWASDHHTAWVNSAALARAGIGPETSDPPGGRIVRDEHGAPTGALLEEAAELVAAHLPEPSVDQQARGLAMALNRLAAGGIAWAQEASLEPGEVDVYRQLAGAGRLPCRVNAALRADPRRWRGQGQAFDAKTVEVAGLDGFTIQTVKFFADGIIESGTASMLEPYEDAPCDCGVAVWDPAELAEAVASFDAAGYQVHIHAIGDGGVRSALDAIERAAGVNGPRDRRPVIAHTQVVHPDDMPRFAHLGVIANFEPLWAQRDPLMVELTEPRLGAERAARQYPMGGLERLGARLSFGSDWPVSSERPLDGLMVAVTRQTAAGQPPGGWLADQALPLAKAMAAYTTGVAYQAFEDDVAGALAPGQRADLCLLEADPWTLAPGDLRDVAVLGTWLAGEEVYTR